MANLEAGAAHGAAYALLQQLRVARLGPWKLRTRLNTQCTVPQTSLGAEDSDSPLPLRAGHKVVVWRLGRSFSDLPDGAEGSIPECLSCLQRDHGHLCQGITMATQLSTLPGRPSPGDGGGIGGWIISRRY